MNCINCKKKSCRLTQSCDAEKFEIKEILQHYQNSEHQKIVQAAARLVDHGRAGTLSRIEEIIEFSKDRGYKKLGLAYCYGMENLAGDILTLLKSQGIAATGISCTVGGASQSEVNQDSQFPGVSCNPLSQASQLKSEGVDFAILIGLCLGHDILFHRSWDKDQTTLIVKDRATSHNPIKGIKKLISS